MAQHNIINMGENIYEDQKTLLQGMRNMERNMKKDGPSRKTVDYYKRHLKTLEQYWEDYEINHDRLKTELSRSHVYFTESEYETTKAFCQSLADEINKQYQALLSSKQQQHVGISEEEQEVEKQQLFKLPSEQAGSSTMETKENQGARPKTSSRGTTSKMDDMMRKQMANFKAFARTMDGIYLEAITDRWEFEDALKTIQARWSVIDSLHWEIDSELNEEDEYYEFQFNKYEKQFINMKKAINNKMWSVAHREKSTPQMEIPNFGGHFNQWVSFKDLFTEAIHNNPALSNAQKMQFLKAKVKGEAERLIQHLHISSENYVACWEILKHRYDNKKLIFTSHMNTFLGLPNIQQQSGPQLKRLHDVAQETINAIKNLGVNINTWDPILVHILSQKLDAETYSDYIQSLKNPRELPLLQDFMDYIETKFTSLETARRRPDTVNQRSNMVHTQQQQSPFQRKHYNYSANQHQNSPANKPPIAKAFHASTFTCPLCNENHGIYNCKQFKEMSSELKLKTANKLQICTNCLFSHHGNKCVSKQRCRNCQAQHNTMLHDACMKATSNMPSTSSFAPSMPTNRFNEKTGNTTLASQDAAEILLATAQIKVKDIHGTYHVLRALIDPGSQINLITERAAQMLNIKRKKCQGVIFGVGQQENNCKGVINITCTSTYNDFTMSADVLIMNSLVKNLPNRSFNKPSWTHIQNINLADPEFHNSRPIDILFGAEVYARIMQSGIIKGEDLSQPLAQQTSLGWLLIGSVQTTYQCHVILNNLEDIKTFWEIEDISEPSNLSLEDQNCIKHFSETTRRQDDGRYEVRLPMKEKYEENLGDSKKTAIAQFRNLEKKFERQNNLANEYKKFMKEYFDLEHMKVADNNTKPDYYLPHHSVFRAESETTRCRVVFNASCLTSTGYSLNDVMQKGPNLQQDLQTLILKFRQYKYAYIADIEKMYRQILVNDMDQHLQKIVWRESPQQPLQTYQLTTITYGTKAAPFLAMMTLKQLAADERDNYPEAATILEESFYMDDLVHGSHTLEDAQRIISDLISLLKLGKFNLRKWRVNNKQLLQNTSNVQEPQQTPQQEAVFNFKTENTSKLLGLQWNPTKDVFSFDYNINDKTDKPTKRSLLSEISKLYDPLGWLTPLSTKLKLLFQKLWEKPLQWDECVPDDVNREWSRIKTDIENIQQCEIPRWTGAQPDDIVQLFGFSDASIHSYACVIYARIKTQQNITILAAKSKLIPHRKTTTLPRLELCGAQLLSKLMKKVKATFTQNKTEVYGWTDSQVVLGWLQGEPSRWKPFVANRVKTITEEMPSECWNYVKSQDNPADAASRGLYASQLKKDSLWWQGPEWLLTYDAKQEQKTTYTTNQDMKQSNIIQSNNNSNHLIDELLNKYSSFNKTTRVLAWILRAASAFKTTTKQKQPSYLTLRELRNAKRIIIKHVQECEFETELQHIRKHGKVHSKSSLLELKPFIDSDGFLRVGGRLKHCNISPEMKHPKIIPRDSRLATLLIEQAHHLAFHGGARLTLGQLRQQYWITGGNNTIKKQLRKCVTCKKHENRKQQQLMGDLPAARINPAKPFYHTGVDYTGFVEVKANKGKGIKTTKGYVAVFVCMVTKAVHLELVSDLSSSAFLAALRRMSARRGAPRHLYSDQGTNFIAANRRIQDEINQIREVFDDKFRREITDLEMEWHFNAPAWPNASGLMESAVKSLKFHLKRVVGQQKLTFEEYSTILAQLEACLNTRPLCPLTEDIEDLNFLTPAHFLATRPGLTVIETAEDARTRWHLTQQIFKEIWKQWKSEYLTQLTARSKWRQPKENMEIGDLVVIHEDNELADRWRMGRVVEVHPGTDNYVRVVTLKTKNGLLRRPINKLSRLPLKSINDKHETSQTNNHNQNKQKQCNIGMKRTSFVSIALALTFFMTLLTGSQGAYNVTELKTQSLYFDPLANMQIIRDQWTLVVYYNMTPYWEGTTVLKKLITHLENTCAIFETTNMCNMILTQLNHENAELEYYNQLLLNQRFSEHSRQRRGLINGVGYVANALFGVLDERFAEKYTNDIEHIKRNQAHLAKLWQNQTSVVESEYNILKRTEQYVATQHKIIDKRINGLQTTSNMVQKQMSQTAQIQEFTMMAVMATNLLMNLRGNQDMLLDTLTDISHGQFNIHLLTPSQLKEELNIILSQLSEDITLPIGNIQRDFHRIYKLLRIKARVTQKYFLCEVTFPLISIDKLKIYRIIPIPQRLNNNSMLSITPISSHIAVNLRRDSYLPITTDELASCYKQEEEVLLCQLQKPIYHLNGDNNFCDLDDNTKRCKTETSPCVNKWFSLYVPSEYLYYCCQTYTVKIICGDQITMLQLNKSGVIIIDQNCMIKGPDITLFPHKQNENKLKIDFPAIVPHIDQINNIVNTTLLFDSNFSNTDEIPVTNSSLQNLEKEIQQMKRENAEIADDLSPHDIHQYVLLYILVAGGIVTALLMVVVPAKVKTSCHYSRHRTPVAAFQ